MDSGIRNLEKLKLSQLSKEELIHKILALEERERDLSEELETIQKIKLKSDKEQYALINDYKKQLKELSEIYAYNQRITENYKKLVDLKLGNTYNINATWIDKIVFVLKTAERPLRSSEIIEILIKNDVTFRTLTNYQKGLSTHLTKALKNGRIVGTKPSGRNGYLFSLPSL